MASELVGNARLAGYRPVFLMKNMLLQKSANFGYRDYQFSSLDRLPKSYLTLVAFVKGSEEEGNLSMVVLTNQRDELLCLADQAF